jgi:hypothetical protein
MFAQVAQSAAGETGQIGQQVREAAGETAANVRQAYEALVPSLPKLFEALAILVLGWLGAILVAFFVRMALRRTGFDRKLAEWCGGEGAEAPKVERAVAKGVYYLLLVFVLVAFFDTLGLTQVTQSLNGLLGEVLTYLPRIVGAALLLLCAWVAATVTRFVARRVAGATKLDERLASQAALEEEQPVRFSNTLSNTVYWLVFLLFLPAILNALALPGLLAPVQQMVAEVLGFLPNLFAAAVILVVGWLVARIVQRIITNLLAAVGTDNLTQRVGLTAVMGQKRLSQVLGLVVYVLILLPVLVASLNALQLEAVTGPASEMLHMVLTAFPAIFAAVVVLAIAYVVGRIVAGLCTNLLTGMGFNRLPAKLGLAREAEPVEGRRTPAEIGGYLVMVATMLFAAMQALPIMGFDLLAGLISQFLVFSGHLLVGLAIFAIGLYLANLASRVVRETRFAQADLMALVSRISIIVLASAIALRQMGLANEIIASAFTIVLGTIGVAIALAFGLGGREAAAQELERLRESRAARAAAGAQQAGSPTPPPSTAPARPAPGAPVEMPTQRPTGPFTETRR